MEQSTDVNDVQINPVNNKRLSNPFPPDPNCLRAHIEIKFSLSVKYGTVKMSVKHIRCILMLFGHKRAGNVGLNLCVAVQTSIA